MICWILVVIFLLLMGAVVSATFAERTSKADRPPIYWDSSFMNLINLLWVPMLVVFIVLLIMNWKTTLIIAILSLLFSGILLKRISEYVIVLPLHKLLTKKDGE